MYLKSGSCTNGKTQLSVVEDCWDNKSRRIRQCTIEILGNVEDLKKKYADVYVWADEQVKRCEKEHKFPPYKEEICIHPAQRIDRSTATQKNIGSIVPLSVYAALGLETTIKNFSHKHKIPLNLSALLRLLVVDRFCNRYSILPVGETKDWYFFQSGVNKSDIPQALEALIDAKEPLCMRINRVLKECNWFDFSTIYFDVIDFYCETPLSSYEFCESEAEKTHKQQCVRMAVLCDAHGIPFVYRRFSGNVNSVNDLQAVLDEMVSSAEASKLCLFSHNQDASSILWRTSETYRRIDYIHAAYDNECWSDSHIEAYFLASFVARVIVMVLSMMSSLSCVQIIHELTLMTGVQFSNKWWLLAHRSTASDALLDAVHITDLKLKHLSSEHIRYLFKAAFRSQFFNPNSVPANRRKQK